MKVLGSLKIKLKLETIYEVVSCSITQKDLGQELHFLCISQVSVFSLSFMKESVHCSYSHSPWRSDAATPLSALNINGIDLPGMLKLS